MTPTKPIGDGGDPPAITKKEREALAKVELKKFVVNPLKVKIFGTVTATWSVTIPPGLDFEIAIQLNGKNVATDGSQTFTVSQPLTIELTAVIADDTSVGRLLKGSKVVLDTAECQDQGFPASVVTVPIQNTIAGIFGGNSQFSLKSDPSVTAGEGTVDIDIPISISVPNWFDADMDIAIQLTISGRSQVFVKAPVVNPKVSWSFLSNLASLGCTSFIGDGMTQISKVFLEEIVDAQLIPGVTQKLTDQVNSFTSSLTASDPQHRTFVMTSLIFSNVRGLLITACPK